MLVRIRTILQHLAEGQRVTASNMAQALEVSHRTVARDFDYMINGLDLPIRYEYKRRSYILAGPLPSFFSLNSDEEGALPVRKDRVKRSAAPAVRKRAKRKTKPSSR